MKQLLINFLIIFGSAFVFIQCAKLLTLNDKISRLQLPRATNINITKNKQNKATWMISNAANMEINFKNKAIGWFFNKSSLSYNMMGYIDSQTLFYYPYINFTYYDLFRKYPYLTKGHKSK